MFKRLLVSALFAGFAAGLIGAALTQLFVTPVLMEAELYETGELVHFGAEGGGGTALVHDHDSHTHALGEDGMDRALLSLGAAIAINISYALLLVRGHGHCSTKRARRSLSGADSCGVWVAFLPCSFCRLSGIRRNCRAMLRRIWVHARFGGP